MACGPGTTRLRPVSAPYTTLRSRSVAGGALDAQARREVRLQHQQRREFDLDVQDGSRRHLQLSKAGDTGPNCSPADLRQSPDDKYLYLSCFVGSEIQAWDISDPEHIKLHDTIQGVVQPNMMHVTYDGRRLYFTNSAISSIDYSSRYSMQLIQIGPDGRMKLDPNFKIDFAKAPEGPAPPHDMLLN